MPVPDGFPGQKLIVLPRPAVRRALGRPGTAHLVVTDCGYFPEARAHGMSRPQGTDQAIVIACVRGRGWCEIRGQRHDIGSGQVLVIPPGVPHGYGADPDDPWTVWWLHVTGPDLRELLLSSGITASEPVREVADAFRIATLVDEVVRTLDRDGTSASILAASGAAWHLLAILSSTSRPPGGSTRVVDRAREYLSEHVAEPVTVSELASLVRLSASHLSAVFRREVGVPLHRYQTELRMARARELLDTTEHPVGEIAALVGYDDPFYFSRQFRALHGVAPREYRRHRKG